MDYKLILKPSVQKDLDRFPDKNVFSILKRIESLAINPRPFGIQKLSNTEEQYRIRIGRYRVLFEIDDSKQQINVYRIKHRKEAYRKR